MTKVDFYVLPQNNSVNKEYFCCKLTEKAFRNQLRIYIRTLNQAQDKILDDLLWTFRAGSFLPHRLASSQLSSEAKPQDVIEGDIMTENLALENIVIGSEAPAEKYDLLINLADTLPSPLSPETRIAEIVPATQDGKLLARQRYRDYQRLTQDIETHQL